MQRIGIIGAENSHAAAVAKEINVARAFPDFQVTHVWGETAAFAHQTAAAGQIPHIVAQPEEMLGQVDGIMVDHRDGQFHLAAALPFLQAGIPVFVDKPLSTSLAEAKNFLKLRRQLGVAVTTMSTVPLQSCLAEVRQRLTTIGTLRCLHLHGPGDPLSPYSGIFFYGIHQTDLAVALLGTDALSVTARMHGRAFTAVVCFPGDVTATISMPGSDSVKDFSLAAVGTTGTFACKIIWDANTNHATTALFTQMFATGKEPFDDTRMLAPIALLEAMQHASQSGGAKLVEKC